MTSIRIGRIAGVSIGFNWSVLVILALVTWSLSSQSLPESSPGHSTALYWLTGVVTAALFFASLLAHELAHSLVARRAGVEVREITLWMLGGVSKMESDAKDGRDELRIALVGPLCSLALFLGFGVLASTLTLLGAPELLITVPALLSALNLMLALFNLLPAFPLDGGRVLRGFLWRRHGDKLQATRAAARTGRVFGWAFVTGGVLLAFTGVAVSGVWLAFIGLFIVLASTAESSKVEGRALLAGVRVDEVMTPEPITAPADITVDELLDTYVLRSRASAYPVLDGDQLVGLVTLDRVRQVPPATRSTVTVRSITCPLDQVARAEPSTSLVDLLPTLVRSSEGRALVLDHGQLVGIVSNTDVTRAIEVRSITPTGAVRPPAPTGARPSPATVWPPPPHRGSPTPR